MKEIAGLKVYSVKDIGELLNLTTHTVLTMIKDGRLPAAKLGRSYAITEDALRRYLNGETGNSRRHGRFLL
jgi:excisionase family DNA binding protein